MSRERSVGAGGDAGAGADADATTAQSGETTPLLEVRDLKKYFSVEDGFLDNLFGSAGKVHAVDGTSLTVEEGETLALVGESGCGKTTLGQTITKLQEPTAGTIRFKGEDITDLSSGEMRSYREDIQMIFQDPSASLNPRQTIGDILRTPMKVHGIGSSKRERTERARELLERVGLKGEHLERYPNQFSGGQQQRIGLARALTVEPDLVVADEPVSALDVSVQAQVLNRLDRLQEEFGLSIVFIAHDLSVVRHIADRVAVMYLGQIVEQAPVDELFEAPEHPYTKSLLSSVPRIDPGQRTDRIVLRGTVPSPIDPPDGCRFHTRCPAIIPPEDWPGSQAAFRRAFTFRSRLEADEMNPDAIRDRLESDGETTDAEAVADRLLEVNLPGEVEDLPGDVARSLADVALLVAEGRRDEAVDSVRDLLPSPCAGEAPRMVGDDHRAKCHRVDPEHPAGELLDDV
ncbi:MULTISPECIES: ABC transporter ATP-binding protein [Halorussus]|uniref:ABC transporter ATP-binding protein n=1 Tax=Halorussus TaxID=1070314 RepID=UPI0020A0D8B1|nr:oligopeptide/dipeptide ABC transporter ATP-binding protein [Halorussus vallis]USZ77554.1 ATP-binding cassette domain-containing protein [Halorussus vallis]